MTGVGAAGRDEAVVGRWTVGVGREVEHTARVGEQVPRRDRVGLVPAGAECLDGLIRHESLDRRVEIEPAVLDEAKCRRGDERLGHACDAEPSAGRERLAGRPVRRTGRHLDVVVRGAHEQQLPGHGGKRDDCPIHKRLELVSHRPDSSGAPTSRR